MTERPATEHQGYPAARLAASRLATRAAMMAERGWPLALPFLAVLALFLSAAWLGLFARLPDAARLGAVAAFALAGLAALYPLRFFRLPAAPEVDRRIEAANGLLHAPLGLRADRPAGSAFSQALWEEHRRRMEAGLGRVGADLPRPRVPERDPWALRAVVALVFVAALAFSLGPQGGSVADAFRPRAAAATVPPRIDAWVTPPAYTGKPPVLLAAGAEAYTVPQGSEVALRVTGGPGDETLTFRNADGNSRDIAPGQSAAAAPEAAASRGFSAKLDGDGELALRSGETKLGRWRFAVIPDRAPRIAFAGEPKRAANGTLELNYRIEDDYGAASASADFELAEPPAPGARPLYPAPDMQLVLPRRGGKADAARTTKDLTRHVWAGSTVRLTLEATDDAGQIARSETKVLTMPERPFANPLARALIEQRRLLALDANARPRVLDLMDAITLRPEDTFDNMAHYLAIMSARSRLRLAESDDQLRDVVSYLWDIALGIEEGDLSAAERKLRQAQQNLEDLLKKGAGDEEIDKAMKELRQAMQDFLREFAQRHPNDRNAMPMPDGARELSRRDLDRLMDQIENLAKSGDRDSARQLLSQLQDMMNNLQAGSNRQQPGGEQSEARRQMDRLGEIMRRQQEMMNETYRTDRMRPGPQGGDGEQDFSDNPGMEDSPGMEGWPGMQDWQDFQGGRQPRQGGGAEGKDGKPMTEQEYADALKQLQEGQGKLRQELEELGKGLEGMGLPPNRSLGDAGREMGRAERSLDGQDGNRAVGHQGRALEALRKGARDMMQQLQAMQGEEGGAAQGGVRNADRDPLGRPRATQGPDFGDSVKVPDEIDVQRARRILEEIRKRLGNALSPEVERSYLERLLEMQ